MANDNDGGGGIHACRFVTHGVTPLRPCVDKANGRMALWNCLWYLVVSCRLHGLFPSGCGPGRNVRLDARAMPAKKKETAAAGAATRAGASSSSFSSSLPSYLRFLSSCSSTSSLWRGLRYVRWTRPLCIAAAPLGWNLFMGASLLACLRNCILFKYGGPVLVKKCNGVAVHNCYSFSLNLGWRLRQQVLIERAQDFSPTTKALWRCAGHLAGANHQSIELPRCRRRKEVKSDGRLFLVCHHLGSGGVRCVCGLVEYVLVRRAIARMFEKALPCLASPSHYCLSSRM